MLAQDQGIAQGSWGSRGTRHLTLLLSTVLSLKAARSVVAQEGSQISCRRTRDPNDTQELQCNQKETIQTWNFESISSVCKEVAEILLSSEEGKMCVIWGWGRALILREHMSGADYSVFIPNIGTSTIKTWRVRCLGLQ